MGKNGENEQKIRRKLVEIEENGPKKEKIGGKMAKMGRKMRKLGKK